MYKLPMSESSTQSPQARQMLQRHFSERLRKNPQYSLRSFARTLGLSPTILSLVLNGKRSLSKKALAKVVERLTLNPDEVALLENELQARRQYKHGVGAYSASSIEFQQLTMDQFEMISHWVHYAILSLLEIPGEKLERNSISKRIGIHPLDAQAAIERLERLGLLEQDEKGRWKQSGAPLKLENRISTAATRNFHHGFLEKARESLEIDPIEKRDFSSVTFAMDPKLVPYALEKIRAFRRSLMKELETMSPPEEVYHLSVQLFPLSHSTRSKNEEP
jgi:uncharacterized protein (TIGR02147 family)